MLCGRAVESLWRRYVAREEPVDIVIYVIVCAAQIAIIVVRIQLAPQPQLFQVVQTRNSLGPVFGLVQRRQEQRGQDGDDGDDHQQLNESESSAPGLTRAAVGKKHSASGKALHKLDLPEFSHARKARGWGHNAR